MHAGELIFILVFNCIVIFILYCVQKRLIEKNIKRLKEEVQELEDLVAAIIEEFEDIADIGTNRTKPDDILSSNQEMNINYPTVGDFLDNLAENEFSEPVSTNEAQEVRDDRADTAGEPLVNITVDESRKTFGTSGAVVQQLNDIPAGEISEASKPAIKLESINDPRHRRIIELWQQGVTIEEIARQLGTGRGEIQLVLGLYRRS